MKKRWTALLLAILFLLTACSPAFQDGQDDGTVTLSLYQRTSTANAKIIGYSQQKMGQAVHEMIQGKVDAAGCIALMDEYRIAAARELGAEGF